MAKILLLDQKHYLNGQVPLKRGDKWTLQARVVDRIGGADTVVDLTDCAASAFFEAEAAADVDGLIPGTVALDAGAVGALTITLDAATTPTVADASEGVSLYATILHPTLGLITVETVDEPLLISDRGFTQF